MPAGPPKRPVLPAQRRRFAAGRRARADGGGSGLGAGPGRRFRQLGGVPPRWRPRRHPRPAAPKAPRRRFAHTDPSPSPSPAVTRWRRPRLLRTSSAIALTTGAGRAVPLPLYGVTVDDISGLSSIPEALSGCRAPHRASSSTEKYQASSYRAATVAISKGQLRDGRDPGLAIPDHGERAGLPGPRNEYLAALGDVVDIWGNRQRNQRRMVGTNSDVVAKMTRGVRHRQGSGAEPRR